MERRYLEGRGRRMHSTRIEDADLFAVELFRVRKFFKVSIDFDSLKFPHLPI